MRLPASILFSIFALLSVAPSTRADVLAPAGNCIAQSPGTTAAELQFASAGIYNPGTTTETVLCSMPRESTTESGPADVYAFVYYRVLGGTPSAVTCTMPPGSASIRRSVSSRLCPSSISARSRSAMSRSSL